MKEAVPLLIVAFLVYLMDRGMITAEQVAGQLMTLNFTTSFNEFGCVENTPIKAEELVMKWKI
jgi:hypothetical protein